MAFNPIKKGAFIVTLEDIDLSPTIHQQFLNSLHKISQSSQVICVNFGNPANLALLDTSIAAIQIFESNKLTQLFAPQLLFGAITAKGKLPLDITPNMPKGKQIRTSVIRLKYTIPEEVGIPAPKLVGIDAIVQTAIREKAIPGCQVVVAKEGKIIYSKTFGYHTYRQQQRVEKTDLYDVASITKVAATTLAAMKLYEVGKIDLRQSLDQQMELPKGATIKKILLKDLFIHKSGLQRNMPIAAYLNNKGYPRNCTPFFCRTPTAQHSLEVASDFYFNPSYLDSIWRDVSHLERKYKYRRYLYSDVNFYLIHRLIEEKTRSKLDDYAKWNFYQPLGLRYCTYKPLERFPADIIVPTQKDRFWRKNLVRGYVHDESAAILGGVGGNAGLFANAEDLAVLFQMLLNGGQYGGERFISQKTIDYFTSSNHGNHRGLGFDKGRYNYTVSKEASLDTYGHSGFSGTCVWVDPQEELVYVFLSNRIHPDPKNNTIKKSRVRQRIHQVIYDAIESAKVSPLLVTNEAE